MAFKMNITKRTSTNEDTVNVENSEALQSTELMQALELIIGRQMSYEVGPEPQVGNPDAEEPKEEKVSVPVKIAPKTAAPTPKVEQTKESKFNQVELIGSKSSGFPIAEKLNTIPDVKKYTQLEEQVQAYVVCNQCGHEKAIKVLPHFNFIYCPNCKTKLHLEKTMDIRGEADENGDAFIARYKFKTPEERWNEKHLPKPATE